MSKDIQYYYYEMNTLLQDVDISITSRILHSLTYETLYSNIELRVSLKPRKAFHEFQSHEGLFSTFMRYVPRNVPALYTI